MLSIRQAPQRSRALELPEILSGLLVLFVILWEACFERLATTDAAKLSFLRSSHLILCGLVWFNSAVVLVHVLAELRRRRAPGRFLWLQLITGCLASFTFSGGVWHFLPFWCFWASVGFSFLIGTFSFINIGAYIRMGQKGPIRNGNRWSPSVIFFTYMVAMVLVSTLLLLTPGAAYEPLSVVDALFTCASATSITGLTVINVADTLTPFGKFVLLLDIQVGALGVMTFSYLVLLMVGKKLNVRDSMSLSGLLDQEGVNIIPALLKAVFAVTFVTEAAGAVCLYFIWQGNPAVPQDALAGYAIFHAVSAFCNAGITLFPAGMAEAALSHSYAVQVIMMLMMLAGTLGFGVHLEALMRVYRRLSGQPVSRRWSTNTWLVVRVTLLTLLVGTLGMTLLGMLEPAHHGAPSAFNAWEAVWNSVGRSAGFNLTDIADYGIVYKLFLCLMMFVGGNPAGTGGGVYAPVFALCVLEVFRVLRGATDVELHNRRIARNTVERAMATLVLSILWIVFTVMLLLLLEPGLAAAKDGFIKTLFMEVSAYTTTGYDLGAVQEISTPSKIIISLNMLFGRVGMFTFMLIFIRQKAPSPLRYPETRLPLS